MSVNIYMCVCVRACVRLHVRVCDAFRGAEFTIQVGALYYIDAHTFI